MERTKAEAIVRRALELPDDRDLATVKLRTLLTEKRSDANTPRHRDLFALLGRVRQEAGYGSITVELAESMSSARDIVDYLARMGERDG